MKGLTLLCSVSVNLAELWRAPSKGGEGNFEGIKGLGFEDLFVLVVCADPEPDDGVAVHDSEGTITDVDPGGPESFDLLKPEGAVIGVCGPEAVLLAGPLLDFG